MSWVAIHFDVLSGFSENMKIRSLIACMADYTHTHTLPPPPLQTHLLPVLSPGSNISWQRLKNLRKMHEPWYMSLEVSSKSLVLQACQHNQCSLATAPTTVTTTVKYRSGSAQVAILPSLVTVTILCLRQTGQTHWQSCCLEHLHGELRLLSPVLLDFIWIAVNLKTKTWQPNLHCQILYTTQRNSLHTFGGQ